MATMMMLMTERMASPPTHRSVGSVLRQEAHELVGQAKRRATKIRPQDVGGGILERFLELPQMPTSVADVVISAWLL